MYILIQYLVELFCINYWKKTLNTLQISGFSSSQYNTRVAQRPTWSRPQGRWWTRPPPLSTAATTARTPWRIYAKPSPVFSATCKSDSDWRDLIGLAEDSSRDFEDSSRFLEAFGDSWGCPRRTPKERGPAPHFGRFHRETAPTQRDDHEKRKTMTAECGTGVCWRETPKSSRFESLDVVGCMSQSFLDHNEI